MADFNELWGADNPSDSTNANEIDDYENNLRNMLAERVQDMIYGFTSGEDTDAPGMKKVTYKQQSSAPGTPNADEIVLYAIDDGSNCGLYAKNEDGYATQILKKIGSTFTIPSGAYGADSIDEDDIRLANNANLTGRNNAGDGDVNILKVNTSDGITMGAVTTLPDTSALATSGAPAADAQIANKKYVDDYAEPIVSSQATAGLWGSWTANDTTPATLALDTVYQAQCDGLLCVYDSDSDNTIYGYTDSSNPPTTIRVASYSGSAKGAGFTMPVKKDEYVKITCSSAISNIYWLPFGTGGLVDQS